MVRRIAIKSDSPAVLAPGIAASGPLRTSEHSGAIQAILLPLPLCPGQLAESGCDASAPKRVGGHRNSGSAIAISRPMPSAKRKYKPAVGRFVGTD